MVGDTVSIDDDRRLADAQWRGETTATLREIGRDIREMKDVLERQNGRIGRLERWRSGIVAVGTAALTFIGLYERRL